jgi:hypothetical protein
MAIELEQGLDKSKIWSIIIFVIAVLVSVFLLSTYLYLEISSKNITGQIQEKDKQLLETEPEKNAREELALYETKINDYKQLLDSHKKTGNVFFNIEKMTHPQIWFSNFSFEENSNNVILSATAPDFITISQQIIIFEEQKDILSKIKLSGLSRGEDGSVKFSLTLTFAPQVFKQ